MQRKTPQKRVLFVRDPKLAILGVLSMFSILGGLLFAQQPVVAAATDSTINFQARLLTAPGSVAPDGNYNVEFKIYNALTSSGSSQGSCTGDANCLWTETRTSGNTVHVVNGYLTVNLGSVTALPTTINWDQDTYLSMNIGGTGGSPTWDGEMSPRLHLTAVPYAFRAGQLAQYNATTGYTSTLNLVQPTGGNQIFNIPDQLAAGTYSLLTTNTANANYIQLQGTTPGTAQSGNFNVTGTGVAGVALQTPALDRATAGTLTIGATNATAVTIGPATTMNHSLTLNGGSSGATTFTTPQGSSVPTTINIPLYNPGAFGQLLAFGLPSGSATTARALSVFDARTGSSDVQPAINLLSPGESDLLGFSWDGSNLVGSVKTESSSLSFKAGATSMMYLNKLGGVGIGLGFVSPNYTLDVAGDTNISTGSVYRIGGTAICSVSGCTPTAGSSNYIQLQGTTPGTAQTGNFNVTGTGVAGVALQTPLLDTASAGTLSIGTSMATSLSLAKTGVSTTVNGGTIFTLSTGYSSGVNSTITASLVTNNTVLPVTATTTGLTFTMPTTSIGSAGRVVYVTNTGSNPFLLNIGSAIMTFTTSSTATLYWNGTAWTSAGLDSGVNAIGALDLQSATANGASIVANLLYLQSATASFPGLVNTAVQTFAGAKTFNALITGGAGATIGTGPIALTGNNASSFTTTAGALTLTSASTAIWSTSGASADLTVEANTTNNLNLLTTGAGTVALGDLSTTTINIGRGSNIARTISIGNGGTSQAQTISIGSTGGTSTLALTGGTGTTAISLTAGANGSVSTTTTGSGKINLNTATSIVAKSTTNSTTAFQVQNAAGTGLFTVDTTDSAVQINTSSNTGVLNLAGGFSVTALPAPSGLAVANIGTAGSTTYTYKVYACDDSSCLYYGSAGTVSNATGNATLNGTNYNTISWNAVVGARQYALYRTAGPSSPCWISYVATNTANDQGCSFSIAAPTTSTSGSIVTSGSVAIGAALSVSGAATFRNSADSSTAFQIQNANGSMLLDFNTSQGSLTTNGGGIAINGVANPAAPTLTSSGTGGSLAAQTYLYRLDALGTDGTSTTASIPSSPGSVITSGSTSKNTLSWIAVPYATGYDVYRSIDGGNTWFVNTVSSATTSIIDNGTTYTWGTGGAVSNINSVGGINLQSGTGITFDGGTGNYHMQLFDNVNDNNSFTMGNYNSGGVINMEAQTFEMSDTNTYRHDFLMINTGAVTFENNTNSTVGFTIQNSGAINLLTADTTDKYIQIGSAVTDGTAVLLNLDKFNSTTEPTEVDGGMYYNTALGAFRCGTGGVWSNCGGFVASNNAIASAFNGSSTAEQVWTPGTNITANVGETYQLPANYCMPGRTLQVEADGIYSTTTTAESVTLKVKIGTTVLGATGANTPTISMTGQHWRTEFNIICVSTTSAIGEGYTTVGTSTLNTTGFWPMQNAAAVTIPSAASNLTMSVTFAGTTSSSNTVTLQQLIIRSSGP